MVEVKAHSRLGPSLLALGVKLWPRTSECEARTLRLTYPRRIQLKIVLKSCRLIESRSFADGSQFASINLRKKTEKRVIQES